MSNPTAFMPHMCNADVRCLLPENSSMAVGGLGGKLWGILGWSVCTSTFLSGSSSDMSSTLMMAGAIVFDVPPCVKLAPPAGLLIARLASSLLASLICFLVGIGDFYPLFLVPMQLLVVAPSSSLSFPTDAKAAIAAASVWTRNAWDKMNTDWTLMLTHSLGFSQQQNEHPNTAIGQTECKTLNTRTSRCWGHWYG